MQLAFILTMPGNNSWNGKWSGDGRLYCVVKSFTKQATVDKILSRGSYGYDFGDGWYARVEVRQVDAEESRKLRAASQGFCGYEWMIDSILEYGKIFASHQTEKIAAQGVASGL